MAAAALCVAGVALGDIDCHFAWQAWRLATWTFTLRGRCGTWRSLCVAGVALGDIDAYFGWQAWHLRHWAGSGDAPGSQITPWPPRLFAWQAWRLVTSTVTLRGRRGTWRHGPSLGDMYLHLVTFAWQAWHLRHWAGSDDAPGSQMMPWPPRVFAWQAWHLVTSTLTLRGRRGTYGTGPALVTRWFPK